MANHMTPEEIHTYVEDLVTRARAAQKQIENYTQEQADRLAMAIVKEVNLPENADKIAKQAFADTGYGTLQSKYDKLESRTKGVLWDVKFRKTVGVIEEDKEKRLVKIAKPVGVVAVLVPSTQPEVTPVMHAVFAMKTRNAIIFSPHPATTQTSSIVVDIMRTALRKMGAPEDLLICARDTNTNMSQQIMKSCDLIMATGGSGMVKAAYSMGVPAYGAGVGNTNVIIDEGTDPTEAAKRLVNSKMFDYSSGCSCENSIIVHKSLYEDIIEALKKEKAYMCSEEEKAALLKVQFPKWPESNALGREIIMKSAHFVAEKAGFEVPEDTTVLLVPEDQSGFDHPMSGEKLSMLLTVFQYTDFPEAVKIACDNLAYQGEGHSSGIYSDNEEHIMMFAEAAKVGRIAVCQAMTASNSGSYTSGRDWTSTLGGGTWGGTISTDNISVKHYLNYTSISYPIEKKKPSDEELFAGLE